MSSIRLPNWLGSCQSSRIRHPQRLGELCLDFPNKYVVLAFGSVTKGTRNVVRRNIILVEEILTRGKVVSNENRCTPVSHLQIVSTEVSQPIREPTSKGS